MRAVFMYPHARTPDDVGGCLFEVYSPAGNCRRSGLGHDVCEAVPIGETWGSDNQAEPLNEAAVEAAVKAAYPGAEIREWRGRLAIGHCPELVTGLERLEAARVRVQEALDHQAAVEAELNQLRGSPRVIDG